MVIQDMGYEVDYLPVGGGEKSGDAIAMRWGYLGGGPADQRVIVIDGGTKESGQALVGHIDYYYGTDRVDLVICTHCDADHASGLSVVIEELQVGTLLMHTPWQHAKNIRPFVTDGRVTEQSLTRRIEGGLEAAHELWELARSRGIPVIEPFSGWETTLLDQTIRILGPSREYYDQLLSKFRCVPKTQGSDNELLDLLTRWKSSRTVPNPGSALSAFAMHKNEFRLARAGATSVAQTAHTPDCSPTTSAENDSSAIVFLEVCGQTMMFTGDAGVEALTHAIEYGEGLGLAFSNLDLFHVPHHGSEHNIDANVLDKIEARLAVVSAAPHGAPKHPSSTVTNALMDRGTEVYATQGQALCYSVNAPSRPGWSPATPVPYDDRHSALDTLARTLLAGGYRSQPRFPRSSR